MSREDPDFTEEDVADTTGEAGGSPRSRSRLRSAWMRVADSVRDFFLSRAAVEKVEAARSTVLAVVGGGTAIGLTAWVASRLMRAHLRSLELTTGSPLLPGIKFWLANEIGLLIGIPMAASLPGNFSTESLQIGNAYPTGSFWSQADWDNIVARVDAGGWFTIHSDQPGIPGTHRVTFFTFRPETIALIVGVSLVWFYGLSVAAQKALEKVFP